MSAFYVCFSERQRCHAALAMAMGCEQRGGEGLFFSGTAAAVFRVENPLFLATSSA
jgi:hypothetical protein